MDALKSNQSLCGLLAHRKRSVYYGYSEDAGTYPVVIVTIVDDVPSTHADNREIYGIVRFQVTILTRDAEYDAIEEQVKQSMLSLGAMRSISTEWKQDGIFYRAIQFRIGNFKEE